MTIKQQGGIFGRNPTFNNVDADSVDIDGGNIDGTVIGASSPAAISGTTGDFSGNLVVDTNTLYVDSTTNFIGVGTTSKFTSDGYIHVAVAGSSKGAWVSSVGSSSNRLHMRFENANGVVGSINTSGSATGFNTSSDYRLKTDAQPMTGASDRVQALNPVNFEWVADGTRTDGFLAHEAQAIVPEAVTGEKDEVDENNNPVYQGIDQSKLVPLLTAALQEALQRIEVLENQN